MLWISLLFVPYVAGCKMAKFVREEGYALENHVLKTVTADQPIKCELDCVDTPLCFSINVHAQKLPSGWITCDLNNSSRTADPVDLVSKAGYRYHQMTEVPRCALNRCIYRDALPNRWFIYDSKKLKIFTERMTWGRARKHCRAIGGELVSINSQEKNDFIALLLKQDIENATTTADNNQNRTLAHWTLDGTDLDVNLKKGATYREHDGIQALYLNGTGEYATTPAVDFGRKSFTIASWVKVLSPINHGQPLYSDWSHQLQFIVYADLLGKCGFMGYNNLEEYEPYYSAGASAVDKWLHLAVAWDFSASQVHVFIDGRKVGTENQTKGTYLKHSSSITYDIGLKRDSGVTLKGYVRNLMVFGKVLAEEELANITDPNKDPFGGVWIGLNDITKEGTFRWADESDLIYTKWASNQPDNRYGYENCVEMAVDGSNWEDTSCGKQLPFVCEIVN